MVSAPLGGVGGIRHLVTVPPGGGGGTVIYGGGEGMDTGEGTTAGAHSSSIPTIPSKPQVFDVLFHNDTRDLVRLHVKHLPQSKGRPHAPPPPFRVQNIMSSA